MNHRLIRSRNLLGVLVAVLALAAAALLPAPGVSGAPQDTDSQLVFYFDDGPFFSEAADRNDTTYVPVLPLARHLGLPYTDAAAVGTLTIRGPGGTLEAASDSNTLAIGSRAIAMSTPVVREDDRWWVPMEFLTRGLPIVLGVPFRHRAGSRRVFASPTAPTVVDIAAAPTLDGTRLTIRTGASVNVRVQREEAQNLVVLSIEGSPLDPTRETLDYRDSAVRSVRFDDSDGASRIVVETTDQLASVRLVPADENRTFYVDFVREETPPATVVAVPAPAASPLDTRVSAGALRVIVIDPGHGGLDVGTGAPGSMEKELTLALARRLRSALQSRLDATVVLTRDGDRELSQEQRAAIANSSRGNLLVSFHIGYSFDPDESSSSVFVMQPLPDDPQSPPPAGALFQPWYRAYARHTDASLRFAEVLSQSLDSAVPRWGFLVREAPMGLLASVAMPAVVVEIGNAANEGDLARLNDLNVQGQLIQATVDAIETFGRSVR